jgi:Glycosyl hydrolases family 2, TIM barrel domain
LPTTYIAGIRWTPDPDAGTLGLEVTLDRPPVQSLIVRARLSLHGRKLVDDRYLIDRQVLDRPITLDVPGIGVARRRVLWAPEHPNLIDAEITLEGERGDVIDQIYSYAGLRNAGWADGHFLLNGSPYYLRMLLNQGYWPESHLTAPSPDALRHDVELARALGFNGVRNHQKVEDPRFLYWCDKLGLLVWGEMANAYNFSATAVERFTREWIDVVRRDYSHPSVVTWVPFNESWGVSNIASDLIQRHYVSSIYHLTHALDTTRPVIGNDGWEHFVSDIWGVHDYALAGDQIRERYGSSEAVAKSIREHRAYYRPIALPGVEHRGQPIVLTEVGGIDYVAGAIEPPGPRAVGSQEEFYKRYAEVIDAILDCPTVQGFCYTQLADTEQEKSGLLTEDRKPKFDIETIREITERPTRAMPTQMTFGLPRPLAKVTT